MKKNKLDFWTLLKNRILTKSQFWYITLNDEKKMTDSHK